MPNTEKIKQYLNELEKRRIIKFDGENYELTHDSLAQKIADKRTTEEKAIIEIQKIIHNSYNSYLKTKTLLDKRQLDYIAKYENNPKLKIENNERRFIKISKKNIIKRQIIAVSSVIIIFAILSFATFYSFIQKNIALKEKEKVETLFTENKQKDSINRIEKYKRFFSEAVNMQENGLFNEAINKFELAKEFTNDTTDVIEQISKIKLLSENKEKFDNLLKEAKAKSGQEKFFEAINLYKQAKELKINIEMINKELLEMKNIIDTKKGNAKVNADVTKYKPELHKKWKAKENNYNNLSNQIQKIINQ